MRFSQKEGLTDERFDRSIGGLSWHKQKARVRLLTPHLTSIFMPSDKLLYEEITFKIIGLAMQVHSELGFGFLERVYENSLMILLQDAGLKAQQQFPIDVRFRGSVVGVFFADILVNDSIILELKAAERIREKHKAQTLHYLKATQLDLGFLFNFGQARLEYKRFIQKKPRALVPQSET